MMDIRSLSDVELLQESVDLECKLAAGRDGQGVVPDDFWPTYSAFANTRGGIVLLGVRDRKGQLTAEGVTNPVKIRKELFEALNNRQKVSANLLTDAHVREIVVDGLTLLAVEVPRATRHQRPVYLTSNPLDGHTYRRLNESDVHVSDEEVRRMLAEQMEDSRDDRILVGYSEDDLDGSSLRAYRQIFANRSPGHPWNTMEDREFLRHLGGWRMDRETSRGGLTLAGLLMFGTMTTIQEHLAYYMLDYQERPQAKADGRWLDRLTLDGTWSGNLFDFFRKVYLKLTAELKVPFRLQQGERKDETPVHEALREALVNVLVHADYSDRASVLVVKRPDMFGFRNPGMMRIPVEDALKGGEADCRNRTLHKMFRLIGVGEQAGTGIPKILQGWQSQHWNPPKLYDLSTPFSQTRLELWMIDLFPADVMTKLRGKFPTAFESLSNLERVAMALAASEGTVNHARLRTVSAEHPIELSKTLQRLTQLQLLESTGGRGAVYHIAGEAIPTPEDVFVAVTRPAEASLFKLDASSPILASSSPILGSSSPNSESSSPKLQPHRDSDGCLITPQVAYPVVDDLKLATPALREAFERLAMEPRSKGRVNASVMNEAVLGVCKGRFVTLRCLSELVMRKPDTLRDHYLSKLVKNRKLILAFPTTPTHERQAYCNATLEGT